jgi:hypothetical protein
MDIIGAWRVTKIITKVHEVTNIWNLVWSGNEGIMGLITGLVGILPGYNVAAHLPTGGYYNASQGGPPDSGQPSGRRGGPQ